MEKGSVAGLDVPPGWEALSGTGFHGITQEDVVRSAVTAYEQVGNKPLSHNPFADTTLLTDPETITHWTASRPGVFNIAVDPDITNQFLSSLNTDHGRVYPCEAGGYNPFVSHSEKDHDNSDFSRARRFAEFLDLTGLSSSADFKAECHEWHRMRCTETGYDVRQYYTRTNKALLTDKHVYFSFKDCRLPKGDRSEVGKTQCEKAKLDC